MLRFHPWVFSGAIQSEDAGLEDGDLVRVLSSDGRFIAVGHYQKGSIAVRVLSFRDVAIDDEFWYSRLSSALNMRIEKSASGTGDFPITTRPSEPIPLWRSLHLIAAEKGSGMSLNMVFT